MTNKVLTSNVAETNTGPSKRMVFTCDFATSGSIEMRPRGATAFITIHTFSADAAVEIYMPPGAEYQSQGASEITVSYDD